MFAPRRGDGGAAAAACDKWLFGPRGTGIVWGNERAWRSVNPIIPTFMDDEVSIRNSPQEIDITLSEIRKLA